MIAPKKRKKREPTDAQVIRRLFPKAVLDSVKEDIPGSAKKPAKRK